MSANRSRTVTIAASKRFTAKVIGVFDVLSHVYDHFGSRKGLFHECLEHLAVVIDVVNVRASHEGGTLVDRESPTVHQGLE
jgi:hypothetical protein